MSRFTALLCAVGLAVGSIACSETDVGVTTKVKAKLAADDTVKAYKIDVDTSRKVVTLSGTVDSQAAKSQAVTLARATEGVTSVVDNVVVAAPRADMPDTVDKVGTTDLTDPGVTAAVKTKLLADPDVAGLKIDVDTQLGVVTLSGFVPSATEKAEAVRIATDTAGVKRVNDKLTVGKK